MRKYFTIQTLLYVSLLLALLASLNHVAFAFSTVNGGNLIEGYISAIAVDMGMLALAGGINQYKASGRRTRNLWGGVIFFSVISVYANWLAGIVHVQPIAAEVSSAGEWLVSLRPIILSGVLPVLVIYLSEIVSGNHQQAVKEAAKEAKKEARKAVTDGQTSADLSDANAAREAKISGRRAQVLTLLQQDRTQAEIAKQLEVSPRTIRRDIEALNGQVRG